MTDTSKNGNGFAYALEMIRRHGLWVLVALAAFPSLNLLALVRGAEAVKHATRVTPGDFLIAILALAGAVEVLRFRRPWRRAVAPAAAFTWVAVAAIATIFASFTREEFALRGAAKEIVQLVEILVVAYGWVRWAPDGERDIHRAVCALAFAVGVNVLLALIQLAYVEHVFHVRGFFEHRNALGTFLAVTLPVLAAAGASQGRHWGVRVWLLVTAALGLCVISSAGLFAAAALGIVAAAVIVGARTSEGSRLPRFVYGLAAAAGIAVIVLFVQPVLMPRLRESQFRSVATFPADEQGRERASMRVRRLAAALDCVRERPALGFGPGRFQSSIGEGDRYRPPYDKPFGRSDDVPGYDVRFDEPGSHGLYVVSAVEMGLLGLVAVGFFLASAVGRAAASSAHDRSGLAAGALGAVLAVTVACLFSSVMVRGVGLVFVIVLALGERAGEAVGDGRSGGEGAAGA